MHEFVTVPSEAELLQYMKEAVKEAEIGLLEGGIPIGSVLVRKGEIIGRGHNRRVQHNDPTAHAEIDCLKNAGRIGSYHDTVLYSSLMPCSLCAGASILFRIPIVVGGENRTFASSRAIMAAHGIKVIDLNLAHCYEMMQKWAKANPELWKEDIGELTNGAHSPLDSTPSVVQEFRPPSQINLRVP
jgi:cytosine deaminase